MNYKKLKPEIKLKYIQNHICTAEECLQIACQHIKWAFEDIKFIRNISEQEDDEISIQ